MREVIQDKDRTLHKAGYLRCTFDFEEGEECLGCDRFPGAGAKQYYVRTNWECEEGDYYCRRCAYSRATGRDWNEMRPFWRRSRPMHGAGWAYLHGMPNWEDILWSPRASDFEGDSSW